MVIVTKARRQFVAPNKMRYDGRLGNVYFHFNVECVKRKNEYFVPFLCKMHPGIADHLSDVHKQVLSSAGIRY